jgi:hypothetical protein
MKKDLFNYSLSLSIGINVELILAHSRLCVVYFNGYQYVHMYEKRKKTRKLLTNYYLILNLNFLAKVVLNNKKKTHTKLIINYFISKI